jgi:exopolyphosphatase/guanosine-5'-triphosphate,3'-diphosphate pyrophosphatase
LSAARIEAAERDAVLVGTAGTATALALVEAGPDSSAEQLFPQPGEGGGRPPVLSAACVRDWSDRLLRLSVDEILALHPEAMPGRADLFPVGVLLLDRVLARLSVDALRVSPYELRYGLALRARRRAVG